MIRRKNEHPSGAYLCMADLFDHPLASGTLLVLSTVFGSLIVPDTSRELKRACQNPIIQFIVCTLIAYQSIRDLSYSISISLCIVGVLQLIKRYKL